MSIPTFNSTPLCSRAAADLPLSAKVRLYMETLPGVDGQFVQTHGRGGRQIEVHGALLATGSTPAAAHQNLKLLLRQKQALADGATVATYVGTDSGSYPNCVLLSYQPAGTVQVSPCGANYTAVMLIKALVVQLTP